MPSARARPTMRGRYQVDPASGTRPMLQKACRKLADRAAMMMSQAIARLMPAPAQGPFTSATMGLSDDRMVWIIGL